MGRTRKADAGTNAAVQKLRREKERQAISYDALAELAPVPMHGTTIWRTLTGRHRPEVDTLLAICAALGRSPGWLFGDDGPAAEGLATNDDDPGYRAARMELPVVAVGQARAGEELLFEPYEPPYAKVSFSGLSLARVMDNSLLPLAAEGQYIILNPHLHPDNAVPHRDFREPVALVRYEDADGDVHHVIKRWRRLEGRRPRVRLLAINPDLVGDDGLPVHVDVAPRRIREAWTVVGMRWL